MSLIRGAGSVKIDGVDFMLVKEDKANGWYWHYTSQIAPPQNVTPEEAILASTNPGYRRTAGWLDWAHGGVGPSNYQSNVRWLSWSEGPITEYPRRIIQPMQRQMIRAIFTASISGTTMTVTGTPSQTLYVGMTISGTGVTSGTTITVAAGGGGAGSYTVSSSQTVSATTITAYHPIDFSYGDVVNFAIGPKQTSGGATYQYYFMIQEKGCIRRITFSQPNPTSDIIVGIEKQRSAETPVPDSSTVLGGSDGLCVPSNALTFTEASPIWTWVESSTLVAYMLLGTRGMPFFKYRNGQWIQSTISSTNNNIYRDHWQTGVYANGPMLWASSPDVSLEHPGSYGSAIFNLPWNQNPMVKANWSTDLFLGGASFNGRNLGGDASGKINGIAVLRDSVMVAVDDGMFYTLPTTGELAGMPIPVIDSKAAVPDDDSGKTMTMWNGKLFIPTARGLFVYDEFSGKSGGTFIGVGPEYIRGNQSPIRGKSVLFAGDPEYLYASFYNGDGSYIMKGRFAKDGEETPGAMVWHAVCPFIAGHEVTALTIAQPKHTLMTNPVLLIASSDSTSQTIDYVVLPRVGKTFLTDPLCKASISSDGDFYAVLPDHDALAPSVYKNFIRLNIVSSGLNDNSTISAYYKVDDGEWVLLANITASPFAHIPFPFNTRGYRLGVKLVFHGNTTGDFAFVEVVSFDFTQSITAAKTINAQVLVMANQLTISGLSRYGPISRLDYLDRLKDEVSTFEVTGPDGILHYAQFDQTTGVSWRPVQQTHNDTSPGFVASFKLNLYDDFVSHSPAYYDDAGPPAYYTENGRVSYYDDGQVG